jgi:hypothetical protein
MPPKFADHFRKLVIPKLKEIAHTQGFFLSLELIDYGEAYAAVWDVAVKLGITRMRDDLILDVREWIDDEIWRALEKYDADLQDYRRTVVEPVTAEIQRWELTLQRHLRQQERNGTCQTTTTTA